MNWRLIINNHDFILGYVSLKGNKSACFVNSEGPFKLHDAVHDFWEKS